MAAATPYDDCFVHHNTETDTRVLYMPGIGTSTGRGLEGYLIDAVLAIEIKKCCTTAYKFIAEHFGTAAHTGGAYQTRIYLFGHSRGAFTVRSVAGEGPPAWQVAKCVAVDDSQGWQVHRCC